MPLPETIAVKYTEEEAEYLSMRPLVRQTFRAPELVDMIVQVSGKDPARVQQILRAGTVVFHSFRYWWQGFDPDPAALAEILATIPTPIPRPPLPRRRLHRSNPGIQRLAPAPFPAHHQRIRRKIRPAAKNHPRPAPPTQLLANPHEFRRTQAQPRPRYREYSYTRRADLYSIALTPAQIARLTQEAARHAPRPLRAELLEPPAISQIVFLCPRPANPSS